MDGFIYNNPPIIMETADYQGRLCLKVQLQVNVTCVISKFKSHTGFTFIKIA